MDTLLALDVHDDLVSGVLLEFGQKAVIVRNHGIARTGEAGLAAAVAEVVRQTGFRQGECRVATAAGNCSFRNLFLPFSDQRKIAKVLPFELEELTSFTMEELHLDSLTVLSQEAGTEIIAGLMESTFIAKTLAEVCSAGCDPEIFTVGAVPTAATLAGMQSAEQSFLLLDIGFRQATLVLVDNGKIGLVRSLGVDAEAMAGFSLALTEGKTLCSYPENIADMVQRLALTVEQTLISIDRSHLLKADGVCFIDGPVGLYSATVEQLQRKLTMEVRPGNIARRRLLKVEPVEGREWNPALMNRALALALWKKKDLSIFNFRKGPFQKRRSLKDLRKVLLVVGSPVLLACCVLIGYLGWEYNQLAKQRDRMDAEIHHVFRTTLPEVARVVNPVQQLQVQVSESRETYGGGHGSGSFRKIALLAELSSRIPETLPVRITRLVAEQDDVRIMAETSDFNAVDNVKRELEKSEMFESVVISSANLAPKGGEVRFELRLQFR